MYHCSSQCLYSVEITVAQMFLFKDFLLHKRIRWITNVLKHLFNRSWKICIFKVVVRNQKLIINQFTTYVLLCSRILHFYSVHMCIVQETNHSFKLYDNKCFIFTHLLFESSNLLPINLQVTYLMHYSKSLCSGTN